VELYADPLDGEKPFRARMEPGKPGTQDCIYRIEVPTSRPADHYTPRVIPFDPEADIPLEDRHILWQK
jgi:starch phosphorylase